MGGLLSTGTFTNDHPSYAARVLKNNILSMCLMLPLPRYLFYGHMLRLARVAA